jgi:hypothetical protein
MNIIRMIKLRMRWAMHVSCMEAKTNAYRILVRKPEGKRPLGRCRCRWEVNIKVDLTEIGWDYMDWINWDQDWDQQWAPVNMVMNLQVL